MKLISIQQRQSRLTIGPNLTERVSFVGSYISILTNTTTVDVLVSADSGMVSAVKAGIGFPTMQPTADGQSLIPALFSYVEFTNPSNTETMTIEYLLSLGPVDDTRTVVQGYIQMDLSAPALQTVGAMTVQTNAFSILQGNALVKERIVQNTGNFPIWWGDSNTDPENARGLVIYPQGSAVINCWGAVHFKAQDGASRLSVVNVLKVA